MIRMSTAEKAVERWKVGGAFSFRVGEVTYVIDPSKVLYLIQHDLTIRFGTVTDVTLNFGMLAVHTVNGSVGFDLDEPQ